MLAGFVAIHHAVILAGVPAWHSYEALAGLGAEIAVQSFFVLSGFLVWQSLERSASLAEYAEKRARRLLPAYIVVIIACAAAALALSPAASADVGAVVRYVVFNLLFLNFLEPTLPGLFDGNRFPEVNGALWTLKIEVAFYVLLPVLAAISRLAGRYRWLLFTLIYVSSEAWRHGLQGYGNVWADPGLVTLSHQLPGQMSFFIVGVAAAAWRISFRWHIALVLVAVTLSVVSIVASWAQPLRAASLGLLVLWLALGAVRVLEGRRMGDLSYGLYIVHFPIIQFVVASGLSARNPALALGLSLSLATIAAFLMWWLVEKPSLKRDSVYRK